MSKSQQLQRLLSTLSILPSHWLLVPVNRNKQPLGKHWQHQPFSPKQLLHLLSERGQVLVQGKNASPYWVTPDGIGLLCGQTQHDFLMAVDADGYSAHQRLQHLASGFLPPTVAFTSGRPGRAQYLFSLPKDRCFRSRKIVTNKGESLELRGTGLQSVLPPSIHPLTGAYRWLPGCAPNKIEVAAAPQWLQELALRSSKDEITPFQSPKSSQRREVTTTPNCHTSLEEAKLLLEVIHPKFADNYDSWIRVGMSLKFISEDLLSDWDTWSRQSIKYQPGECQYKWAGFKVRSISDRTLHYYANL